MPTPEYVKLVQVAQPSTTSTTTRTVPVTYDATKRNAAYAAAYKINPHLSYADFVGMPTAEEIQAKQGEIKTAKPKTEQEKKDSKRAMEVQAYKEEEAKKEEWPVKSVMQGLDILLAPTLPSTWIDAGLYLTGHPTYFRDYTAGEYKPHYLPAAIDDSHTNITPYTAFLTDLFGYSLANKAVRGATRVGSAMAKDAKGAVSELIHPNYNLYFTPNSKKIPLNQKFEELINKSFKHQLEDFTKLSNKEWEDLEDYIFKKYGERSSEMLYLYDTRYQLSGIPKSGLTNNKDNSARVWFHGTPYGGHAILNSSVSNATIGGESALGIKGNFLAADASNGIKPGGGLVAGGNYSGLRHGAEFSYPNTTTPNTWLEKFKNVFGLFKPEKIHPINQGTKIIDPKQMHTEQLPIVDLISADAPIQNSVVYPFYINPGKTLEVDFQGQPWSRAPFKPEDKYVLRNYYEATFAPNESSRFGITPQNPEYIRANKTFNTKEEAIQYLLDKNPLLTPRSVYEDYGGKEVGTAVDFNPQLLKDKGIKVPENKKLAYLGYIEPTSYPQTTNGIVQWGASEGYDAINMKNVIDAAVGSGNTNFPIDEIVTLKSSQQKLAIPTYDSQGHRIPITQRFDWSNPDVRYVLIPGIGLVGIMTAKNKLGGKLNYLNYIRK